MKKLILTVVLIVSTAIITKDVNACESKATSNKKCGTKNTALLTKLANQAVRASSAKTDFYYDFTIGNTLLRF